MHGKSLFIPRHLAARQTIPNKKRTQDWPSDQAETTNEQREVAFAELECSPVLTAALLRPEILRNSGSFAEHYPDLIAGASSMKVFVIVQELDKTAVVWFVVATLLAAVAAGLGLGVGTGSAAVGFACFTGTVAALSVLMALLHWTTK